jgi:glutamate racemase
MAQARSCGPTVGVFDSGVGGLSVVKAIRLSLPAINFIYIADSANAPYGNRPSAFIEQRASHIAASLVGSGSQLIVVACNTATAVAVEQLRAKLPVPVVAMEPAIKPAVALSKNGVIGVLATQRTLESAAVKNLCKTFGQDVELLLQPCPGLVELVERGEVATGQAREALRKLIFPLLARGADTLVLGCTHYVFLEPTIRSLVGPHITIVESSAAVARQVIQRLSNNETAKTCGEIGRETFFTTGPVAQAQIVFSQLWGADVEVQAIEHTSAYAQA